MIHVASPFPDKIPSNPDDLIKPAVDGTLNVLKAASEAAVKRVVLTSSIAAVYDPSVAIPKENEETKKFNEENWTNTEDPHLDSYSKSKTLAERAAWDFVKELPEGKKLDLAVINPGGVLGPLNSKNMSTSILLVKKLMDRSVPAVAKLFLCITDVRDVALAHLKALTNPDAVGNRHIIVSHGMWMKELAQILQKEFKPQGYYIPTMVAPNFIIWLNSLIEKSFKLVVSRLSREYNYDNKRVSDCLSIFVLQFCTYFKMKDVLGITPIEIEKTIIDTANSLIELEILKKPKKKEKKVKTTGEPETGNIYFISISIKYNILIISNGYIF